MVNKKRIAATVGAMALTAVLAIGGTLAYLSSVTETKTNTFSSSKDVKTELTEDRWDENLGGNYTPGDVIAKNPVLTNTSDSKDDIYVAMKLEYIDNSGNPVDYDTFKKYAAVDGFHANWTKVGSDADGNDFYMYSTALKANEATDPIFNSITVDAGIQEEWSQNVLNQEIYTVDASGNKTLVDTTTTSYDKSTIYYDAAGNRIDKPSQLPKFEIKVTGYAVQATGMTVDSARTDLVDLAGFVVKQ